ncbi:MAG: tetratricopeptide repeat protein, partial [Woeseiaceae bacterium]|nr:tetratricopeptide repeat protein [Woeseiaceae bacterium]
TETLLHMLAQIPELKVAARTSSFAYKGQHQDIRRIADALDVAHVLEGSVQRAGDRVRITAQLIRASDGYHVWSDQFDRSLTDIFAIQDEIANEVGTALSASLLGADEDVEIISIGTENIAAYEMYLEALTHKAVGSYGSLTEAIDLLKGALARDPGFHDAKHLLAQVYMQANNTGLTGFDSVREASALIAQVVAARPNDAASRASQVIIDAVLESQTGNAEAFPQALPVLAEYVELAPNEADLRLVLANSLSFFGQPDEAARHFDELLKRDPQNPAVHYGIGEALLRVDKFEDARSAFQRSLELNPDQPNAYANLGDAAAGLGDFVGFIDGYVRASEVDPRDHELSALIAENLFIVGLFEHGNEFLNRALAISPSSPATRRAQLTRTYLSGDMDASLGQARRMLDDNVENRQGAFFAAAWTYAQLKLRNGEAQEAYDYLATVMPNIHEPGLPAPLHTVQNREAVFDIWAAVLPQDELEAKLDAVIERSDRVGFRPEDNPDMRMRVLALKGRIDDAVEFGLEHIFTRPYSWYNYFRFDFEEKALAPLAEDPRVQAELVRLEREEAQAREDVRRYLASRN